MCLQKQSWEVQGGTGMGGLKGECSSGQSVGPSNNRTEFTQEQWNRLSQRSSGSMF